MDSIHTETAEKIAAEIRNRYFYAESVEGKYFADILAQQYGAVMEENAKLKIVIEEANEFASEVTPYLITHGWSWPPERQKPNWTAYNKSRNPDDTITPRERK